MSSVSIPAKAGIHLRRVILCLAWIPACAGMTGCSEMDLASDSHYSYGQKPIENKVGKNGELISPDCMKWTDSSTSNFSNARQSNIGCAAVKNLGLMLENPRDLERGASGGKVAPDTLRNSAVIQKYRSGEVTTSTTTATDSGE